MPEQPPRFAEALLRWLVGGRDGDAVAGDLRESYLAENGRLWYWRQALSCLVVRVSLHRRMLPGLAHDLHRALRMVRRNPGYAVTAMICLAMAMGVNAVLFSFVDSMFYRKLPVPDGGRVIRVNRTSSAYCTWREFQEFRGDLRSLDAAAVTRFGSPAHTGGVNFQILPEVVSANFGTVLRLGTTLGRWFVPEEDSPASEPVMVISHRLWEARLNSDPAVIGKTVRIDDVQSFRIVGVAPPGFTGVIPPISADAWIPAAAIPRFSSGLMNLVARLTPGATIESAASELQVLDSRLRAADPRNRRLSESARVGDTSGFYPNYRAGFRPVLWIGSVVCGMVLLIACVNVANLMLSRAAIRKREMALRRSLGAGRARLFRETLAEGLVIAGGGVALGLILGEWTGRLLDRLMPGLPGPFYGGIHFGVDWRVAIFLAAAGMASAILFSLPPALENSRRDLNAAMNGADGPRLSRQREIYSLAQVTLSLTLLIATALLLRAFQRAQSVDPGFAAGHRLYVVMTAAPGVATPAAASRLLDNALDRARSVPGVQDATLSTSVFGHYHPMCASPSSAGAPRRIEGATVEPNYFAMMHVPILAGSSFPVSASIAKTPAAIVNETMARTWWPGENAIGKPLWLGCDGSKRQMGEVAGIARDGKYHSLGEEPQPYCYLSRRQDSGDGQGIVIVRTTGDPYLVAKPLLSALEGTSSNLRIHESESLDGAISLSLRELRWQASLLASMGVLAIVLAAIGLYGLVAYAVSQRTREIGVRMAMGATPGDVQWMVLTHGLRIAALGICGGLLLSAATMRFLRAYLYGLSPFDPFAMAGAGLLWLVIGMLASWYPARRATRVDPLIALKYE